MFDDAPAPDSAPTDTGAVPSLLDLMVAEEATAAKGADESDQGEDVDLGLDDEDDGEEAEAPQKPVVDKKPEEKRETFNLADVKRRVEHAEARVSRVETERDSALRQSARHEALLDVLQRDNASLLAFLQESKLVDERDLQLRQYEVETAIRQRLAEAEQTYETRLQDARKAAVFEQQVAHFERAIPAALEKYRLVTAAELCDAIALAPQESPDILAIAKRLHEERHRTAKQLLNSERKARRALPTGSAGRNAPGDDFELNANGMVALLQRHSQPGR